MTHRFDTGTALPLKEQIGQQLDAFAAEHRLRPLRDRLNIGLNEVGALAYENTRQKVVELCAAIESDPEKAKQLFKEAVGMSVDVQQAGPWDYAPELNDPQSEVARVWQMLSFAVTRDFKTKDGKVLKDGNGQVLNDREFATDLERINGNLGDAVASPDGFFQEARQEILDGVDRFAVRLESFAQKDKKSGRGGSKSVPEKILKGKDVKETEWDTSAFAPIADDLGGFLVMAAKGAEVGIVKNNDGEVFVGARGQIDDRLIESCGLVAERKVEYDRPGSSRELTYFRPADSPADNNHDVIKKVHGGFLVVLTRNLELAKSIVEAIAHKREAVDVADDKFRLYTRVIQTSEAQRQGERENEWERRAFLRPPAVRKLESAVESKETALVRQKDQFYYQLWNIRGRFVYLDALKALESKMAERGQAVTESDKDKLIESVSQKMWQKVEEIMYINELLDDHFESLPPDIRRVIDMAGGAGDVGLGVTMELLVRGRDVDNVEIVDPQEGTDNFMRTIIANFPPGLRARFEPIAHHALEHGTGYLQETPITPDAMVVAKHACGTLTDDIIGQWQKSESKFLVAMTCCQDKACGHPARYGFSQEEWDRLTQETGWTNLEDEIARSSGHKKEQLEEKLRKGKVAMETMDNARVNYLRRHGFAAELITTDKFPKGDVILARRLPKNFVGKLDELEALEKSDPVKFDQLMLRLDKLALGGDARGMRAQFGAEWTNADFRELTNRFVVKAGPGLDAPEKKLDPKLEQEQKEISIFGMKLTEYIKARGVNDGRKFGACLKLAKKLMDEMRSKPFQEIKAAIDAAIELQNKV